MHINTNVRSKVFFISKDYSITLCSFCLDAKRTKKVKAVEKWLKFTAGSYSEKAMHQQRMLLRRRLSVASASN
jgi:hypothetical protein